jgi:hypothetical protein
MRFVSFFFSCTLLFSCKSIDPIAPIPNITPIPVIDEVYSTIRIPIEINLKNQLMDIEKSLAKSFEGDQKQCEGVSYDYKFIREPINFQFKKSSIYYEVDGKFQIKLNYCPTCVSLFGNESCTVPRIFASCGLNGESMRKLTIGYDSEISLASNFKFQSKTDLTKFVIHDPCEITVFKFDVTEKLKKEVKKELQKLEEDIDQQIESIDIKNQLSDAWMELQKPISIDQYGFLYLNPKMVSVSELNFQNKHVLLDLNLKIAPTVSTNPTDFPKMPLPNLGAYQKEKGLDMILDIRASYDSLSSFVNQAFKDYEFSFKKKKVIIQKFEIFGAQDSKILMKLTFDGSKQGVLYLIGKPKLDIETQKIYLEELDFDLKTKSILLKSAKWLFNERIISEIQKKTLFDLSMLLVDAKETINKELNSTISKGIYLNGNVKDIFIKNLFFDAKNLIVRANFIGELKLKID